MTRSINVNTKHISKYLLTPPKILVFGFVFMIGLGALLLSLPIASQGEQIAFIDALFMSASATCVTGLAVIDPGTTLTLFGKVVLLMQVQIGGLGFMTMATLIALVFNKRISFRERLILQQAMNQGSMEGIVKLVRKVIFYSLIIELTGAIALTLRFWMNMPFSDAAFMGIFHSVSTFNNAGFDILGPLHGPFAGFNPYITDAYTNIVLMTLIFLGGIGFVVLADILELPKWSKLTLQSKVVLTTTLLLMGIGALVIFALEFTNPNTLKPLELPGKMLSALFQSVTTRSGGLSTVDIFSLQQSTQFFMIILMFIGAAPGSTAGGIKVTTFAVLIGAVYTMARGKNDVVLFHNRIDKEVVYKAITMTLLSFLLVITFTLMLSVTEHFSFLQILFEVTSAFSTSGLSMGVTPHLSPFGKLAVSLLMFLGRIGPLTLAYALTPKKDKELFRYPEGKITIG